MRNYSCMNKEFQFKPKMERTPWLTSRRVMEKRSGKTRSSPHGKGVYVTYEGIPEMWKNSQLPVIDKPHINGGFPFKETVCSDSDKEFAIKRRKDLPSLRIPFTNILEEKQRYGTLDK